MPVSDYGQTAYPAGGDAANVPVRMGEMAESLEGRTVRSFATEAQRDAAFASLTAAQKKGVICHVEITGTMGGTHAAGLMYYASSEPSGGQGWRPIATGMLIRAAWEFTGDVMNQTNGNGEGSWQWRGMVDGVFTPLNFPTNCLTATIFESASYFSEPLWFKILTLHQGGGTFRCYRSVSGGFTPFAGANLPLKITGFGY